HPTNGTDRPIPVDRQVGAVSLVAHHFFPEASDLMFQRRQGPQLLAGQVIDAVKDYAFVGAEGGFDPDDFGIEVLDVTDPTNPVHLVEIPCGGFHSDVAVYEHLLVQSFDSSPTGCDASRLPGIDPHGVDRPAELGVRIYDVTDPANPVLLAFRGQSEGLPLGVHNITVNAPAGLLYLNMAEGDVVRPQWGYIDLTDPAFPVTILPMREVSPSAGDGCHDLGLDPVRALGFCAAIASTLIWDLTDPRRPAEVAVIVNPAVNIHHGARIAPDGTTLVVQDELGGAAAGFGCLGLERGVGALWFYDTTDPARPLPLGSFSTSELDPTKVPCTSHFFNFVPDSAQVVVGWYRSGVIVADFTDPAQPREQAVFLPEGGDFWAAYAYRGFLYGASRTERATNQAGGLWVLALDGLADREPSVYDEGTSWVRWSGPPASEPPAGAPAADGVPPVVTPGAAPAVAAAPPASPAVPGLPATGRNPTELALLLLAAGTLGRRVAAVHRRRG
ncbi:MAG TPA: hypothetical protein VG452_02645, partial [Egibacteraceae bacterium]|nr:hypothetical protein [Egibacteraceae bacterium]